MHQRTNLLISQTLEGPAVAAQMPFASGTPPPWAPTGAGRMNPSGEEIVQLGLGLVM